MRGSERQVASEERNPRATKRKSGASRAGGALRRPWLVDAEVERRTWLVLFCDEPELGREWMPRRRR